MNVFFYIGVLYRTVVSYIGVVIITVFQYTFVFYEWVFFVERVVYYTIVVFFSWSLLRWRSRRSTMISPYSATRGRILAHSAATVVSWPAKEGVDAWNDLVHLKGMVSFCCVWTGRENSPTEDWLYPWEDNMLQAIDKNLVETMIFVIPDDGQLGAGQTIEWLWCNRNDLQHKGMLVRTIGEVTRHGLNGDA